MESNDDEDDSEEEELAEDIHGSDYYPYGNKIVNIWSSCLC
jgi:hypothetical protein